MPENTALSASTRGRWLSSARVRPARQSSGWRTRNANIWKAFDRLVVDRQVRPTALTPLWHVAGFALGAGTALMGEKAAHACTVAIEEVIDEHYGKQAGQLGDDESDLRDTIERFRADEIAHRDEALEHGAREAPGYEVLTSAIKAGSRLAIWLSERL